MQGKCLRSGGDNFAPAEAMLDQQDSCHANGRAVSMAKAETDPQRESDARGDLAPLP